MTDTSTDIQPNGTPYVCPEPGCGAAYKHPQHLGLHRYHKHGTPGAKSTKKSKHPITDAPKRKYIPRPKLTASDICLVVLREAAPGGRIPVEALPAYSEWIIATQSFLDALNGKKL